MTTGPPLPDTPPDRIGGETVARVLQFSALLTLALGIVGITGGRTGDIASAAVVTLLIGIPLLRVLWLVVHWWREPDRRFAMIGMALLAVVAAGTLVAIVQ